MAARRNSSHEAVAERLREQPPKLDDVGRARMERRLLERVQQQVNEPPPSQPPARGRRRTARIAAGAAVAGALAAAAATWLVLGADGIEGEGVEDAPRASTSSDGPQPEASFERVTRGEPVERGAIAEGDVLRTDATERTRVRVGAATHIELGPEGRASVERLAAEEVRVRLSSGSVFVQFHPERQGKQRMAVETPLARVEVVGTVFRVEVEPEGATRVSVERGTVRVVPHDGGRARLVRGGEQTRVTDRGPSGAAASEPEAVDTGEDATESASVRRLPDGAVAPTDATQQGTPDGGAVAETEASAPRDPPGPRTRPLASNVRFELAETLMDRGRYAKARHELFAIARRARTRAEAARAWNVVAESWMAQRRWAEAADAYRRAAERGAGTLEGANGLYALGRLRDKRLGDRDAARAAYRRYRRQYPEGVHGEAVRSALCRLGAADACP